MRGRPSHAVVVSWFALLEVDLRERLTDLPPAQAVEAFQKAQADAKENHRRLAFQNHPDRGGDEEKLKRINAAMTEIAKLSLVPRLAGPKSVMNARQAAARVYVHMWGPSVVINTSTTTGSPVSGTAATWWKVDEGTGGW